MLIHEDPRAQSYWSHSQFMTEARITGIPITLTTPIARGDVPWVICCSGTILNRTIQDWKSRLNTVITWCPFVNKAHWCRCYMERKAVGVRRRLWCQRIAASIMYVCMWVLLRSWTAWNFWDNGARRKIMQFVLPFHISRAQGDWCRSRSTRITSDTDVQVVQRSMSTPVALGDWEMTH